MYYLLYGGAANTISLRNFIYLQTNWLCGVEEEYT